jgi:hypothetical protein
MVLVSCTGVRVERTARRCFSAHDFLTRPSKMLIPKMKVLRGRKNRLSAKRAAFWAA